MGEAKARAKIRGYLTRREQVKLGVAARSFGRPTEQSPKGGVAEIREKKAVALEQFEIAWVSEQIDDRSSDPAWEGKPLWDKAQLTTEKVPIVVDRDVLAWVITELDKVPAGSGDDYTLHAIETRLKAMRDGSFQMPSDVVLPVENVAAAE